MVKMIMHGCNGRMGHVIADLCKADEAIEIVAGVDAFGESTYSFPVFKTLAECNVDADVIVDFSSAAAVDGLLEHCAAGNIPVVLCSTGLSDEQLNKVKETSTKVAVLKSANMSVGVNALLKVLKEVSPLFAAAGFDIEIVEKHHNQKLDSPSGTALALADSINESLGNEYDYVYDRSTRREKRPVKEIGISAVRGGTIVGDHDVIFAGQDEVVTLSHRAYSRAIFGKGAIEAAKFLAGKGPGMYDMSDVLA
ncbi:4-hydroxy-tetrahydrodipicolinate reductase [Butyrivibrio sp. CB08]|uniref:4-hydroxy-tetrahydrodipicolinate reductase n=1 Tax=Butyrivibrio sp. CB08 TaxID=2364879 RepID=UPI000EA989DB|nr:4-hydroxy-tetrahydrodipicolinate reductase [Butyrivibrio sp. CB08]RKM60507.1 4-hydroxy-tetrahydrodipicolinate reductase [Butyrivibrio sp. CB08]